MSREPKVRWWHNGIEQQPVSWEAYRRLLAEESAEDSIKRSYDIRDITRWLGENKEARTPAARWFRSIGWK